MDEGKDALHDNHQYPDQESVWACYAKMQDAMVFLTGAVQFASWSLEEESNFGGSIEYIIRVAYV